MKTLTAKEARKQALDESLVRYNEIMEQINNYVWLGRLECCVYREINEENIKKLTDLGFEVIKNTHATNHYLIKW